ncbi:hypothetical protein Mapa_015932 [Marchantia paleacea]|nr:hypothetical protein Mapa_015932 [Marchantia paleacea]
MLETLALIGIPSPVCLEAAVPQSRYTPGLQIHTLLAVVVVQAFCMRTMLGT